MILCDDDINPVDIVGSLSQRRIGWFIENTCASVRTKVLVKIQDKIITRLSGISDHILGIKILNRASHSISSRYEI